MNYCLSLVSLSRSSTSQKIFISTFLSNTLRKVSITSFKALFYHTKLCRSKEMKEHFALKFMSLKILAFIAARCDRAFDIFLCAPRF